MKTIIRKMIVLLLVACIALSDTDMQVNAEMTTGSTSEVVYVDGNPIRVTVNPLNGTIMAEAVNKRDDSSLVISENSENIVTIYDNNENNYVDYELDIEDLSYDEIDVDVYDEDGDIVESYDDVNDLLDDTYEGQAATVTVVTTITVGSLITALLEAAACIAIAGVIYYGAKAAVKAITQKSQKKDYYYKAYIYNKNVFINISNSISKTSAITRIKTKQNVYTFYSSNAKAIVKSTGLGCTASEISDLKGKIRFYHYHTANRNGAHSFYGNPVTY